MMANVSSSNGQKANVPKLRFPGFEGEYVEFRIGEIYAERSERGEPEKELLSVTQNDGVVPRSEIDGKNNASEDRSNYKVVRVGDMVYNSMRMWQGANGISSLDGIVSPAYTVLYPRTEIVNGYFSVLFKTPGLINEFRKNSQGLTSDTWNLKYPQISRIRVYIPSVQEQRKIAELLSRLDARIEAQRQLIEAIKKYKRGVMQHIFSSSSSKAWGCVRLGNIFKKVSRRNTDGKIKNVITNSAEYGLIPQREFFDKDIAVEGNTSNYYVIETGDFVYNPRKSNTAPYGPFNRYTLGDSGIISPLYTCLVLQTDVDPSYLAWYFKSDVWHRYIYDNGSQGVRHDRVSMTDDLLMGIPIAVPPSDKQKQITQMLDTIEARLLAAQSEYALLEKVQKGFMKQLFI